MDWKSLKEGLFKARAERNALPRYVARRYLFPLAERLLGLHITADHFYEPVPNLRELAKHYDAAPRSIPGHDLSIARFEAGHVARLQCFAGEFAAEVAKFGFDPTNYYFRNADALSYYCLLREQKPTSVVEIGQGSSTRVALAALQRNSLETGSKARFLSIDPYTRLLRVQLKTEHVEFEQWHKPIQAVPTADILARCGPGSMLFVDSSHVFKANSDVEHLMLQLYPQLPVGCWLHVHDIVLPYPWPLEFYTQNKWFWNEQDMLASFLAFNLAFEVMLPVYALHRDSAAVKAQSAGVASGDGYSFYLRRCG
jgi:hypothetical protein